MRFRMGRGEATAPGRVQRLSGGALSALLLAGACSQPVPAPEATNPPPAASAGTAPHVELGANAQLDSGNSAYKVKDYKGALAHYRSATARQPSLAAAWFGVYMAESALGNAAAADSAMKQVQAIAPGTMGAHPAMGDSSGGMVPPGHPAGAAPGATGTSKGGLPPGHPTLPPSRP